MRLPLLLCAAAIALGGCNDGGCTLDHCTITSMMGETQSAAPTYQAPSNQASSKVDLSSYGGMYAGVKLPGNSRSSQSTYQAPSHQTSTYQATASIPAGFVAPSIVSGGVKRAGRLSTPAKPTRSIPALVLRAYPMPFRDMRSLTKQDIQRIGKPMESLTQTWNIMPTKTL